MTLFRAIPLNVHAALEVAAAPLLIVAPFALGFGYLLGAVSIALGVLLIGLATSVFGDSTRGNLPLSAHAGSTTHWPGRPSRPGSWRGLRATPSQQSFWSGSASRTWR